MSYPNLSLLVSSYDKYSVCWEPFCHGLKKYWPEHPRLYFITNHLEAPSGTSLKLGDDQGWAKNLLQALEMIPTDYVLYAQEDYWIKSPVNNQNIIDYLGYLERDSADYIRLYPAPGPASQLESDDRLGIIAANAEYRTSLQMALWRKGSLHSLINPEESPWQFEVNSSKRSQLYQDRFWCVTRRRHGIDYAFTAIVNGYWSDVAYRYSEIEKLEINFSELPDKPKFRQLSDQIKLRAYQAKKRIKNLLKHGGKLK